MEFSTLAEIRTRLENECDLFGEVFVDQSDSNDELLGYINAAINIVESKIHNLYEDYFLNKATLTLVSGTSTYATPTDIYANKIRALIYNNTQTRFCYEIKRIMRLGDPAFLSQVAANAQTILRYIITNDGTTGIKLNMYPTPQESGAVVDCWYIRNAKRLTDEDDVCDIPEFIECVYAATKWYVARKEKNMFDMGSVEKELEFQMKLLEDTLTDMTPDESSGLIQKDFSFYGDFDNQTMIDVGR